MSEQNSKPRVVIALYNGNLDALSAIEKQTYKDIELICNNIPLEDINNIGRNASAFFNSVIKDKTTQADLYGFIDGNCILEKNCIEEVVKKFVWSTDQLVGALYTDYKMIQDNIESNQYYTSYNYKTLKTNLINPYIFVNGLINSKIFNEELSNLYYYDALIKIGMNAMIYHIPKRLMTIYNSPKDVQEDIRKLGINVRS